MELLTAFRHSTPVQIRFNDMDAFGHINNAIYLTYLEEARIKFLDDLIHWDYEKSKQAIIMARVEIDFKIPGHFKDELFILTHCSHVGTKSFTLDYEIVKNVSGEKIVIASAKTVEVMFNYEMKKTIEVPVEWREALSKI
jgi:acyl-CoA thioester hydrolase